MRDAMDEVAERRPILFLGGIFTPQQIGFVVAHSKGVVQNAADGFQKSLISGLSAYGPVTVVNLPFVGSYPQMFDLKTFPGTNEIIAPNIQVVGQSFKLSRLTKLFSRMIGALKGLWRADPSRRSTIVIYSAHLPFLVAALLYRLVFRNSRTCLVLPDFPEFMGEGGRLYTIAKAVESRIFYVLARRIDIFVVLTRFMAERLKLDAGRYVVVEGIASDTGAPENEVDAGRRSFLYTGTLARRYGIMQLLEAFQQVVTPGAELWICGDGDSRDSIEQAAKDDPRIHFFGQVSRDEALSIQRRATILVNPRPPTGEFTRYSFPSKTMEYMASGRPVLMHPLPGMPREYLPYFVPPASGIEGLAAAMEEMAQWSESKLDSFGARARDFVLQEKNAVAQCQKIEDLITSVR